MAKIIGNTTATPLIPPDVSGIEATFKRTKYYGDADIIPTDSSLFSYALNDDGQSYTIAGCEAPLSLEIVIPYEHNGLPITAIGSFSSLTFSEMILPKCIVKIKDDAFLNCTSLSKLVIPDGVTYIGANSFYNSSITEIRIPESVKEIGNMAFAMCSELQSVYIGNGIERRGMDIFYSCGDLNVYFTGSESEWKLDKEYEITNMAIHYGWTPVMKGEIDGVYARKEDLAEYAEKRELQDIVDGKTTVALARAAGYDIYGNSIVEHYATKESIEITIDTINNALTSGDTIVATAHAAAKAETDWNNNVIHTTYATKAEIGDIETALDGIIAIQNTLIGGGSV